MLVDISKSAFQNMLELLNTTNGTEYTADDVAFGLPEAYSDPKYPDHNTRVQLTGVGEYSGTMMLYYARLDLAREIMYRNYQGGEFTTVQAFLNHVGIRNSVRTDNIRLGSTTVPTGDFEVTSQILPIDNSYLYIGSREIVFKAKTSVTPSPDPTKYYEIDIPAGSLNDLHQDFASNARVVGAIDFITKTNDDTLVKVEYTVKPDYTEVQNRTYPMAVLVDVNNQRLCPLGFTLKDGLVGQHYTRYVAGGERPFTTARKVRVVSSGATIGRFNVALSALKKRINTTGSVETITHSFGADEGAAGIGLGNNLWACFRIQRKRQVVDGGETHLMNFSVSLGTPMVDGVHPTKATWDALGYRVLGGLEFLNAQGQVICRIEAPTYGIPMTTAQTAFWSVVDQIASMRVELVTLTV